MDPDVWYNIIFKGLRSKASFSNGDVVRLKDQKSYHIAGKVFSVFSEYNFTRPAALEDLTERLNEPIVNI